MAQSRKTSFLFRWQWIPVILLLLVSCGKKPTDESSEVPPVVEEPEVVSEAPAESEAVKLPEIENVPTAAMAAEMSGAELFAQVCAVCHGPKGEGNEQFKSPSIAGLPAWYLKIQIDKFQKDYRGTDPRDPSGLQMHAIASILDEVSTEKVGEEIGKMDYIATVDTLGGDREAGAEIYRERCMECHRFNGHGEIAFRSAPLIGLQDWYLVSQMKKYQEGMRGGTEGDIDGAKMHHIAEYMTEQQMLDVAAHIVELAEKFADWVPRRERRELEASGSE